MKFSHALIGLIFVSTIVYAQPSSSGYGKLKWGATLAEAKAAFPDFSEEDKKVTIERSLLAPEEVIQLNQRRIRVPVLLPGTSAQLSNADGTVILLFLAGKFVGTNIVSVQEMPSENTTEGQMSVETKLKEKLAAKYGNEVITQVSIGATKANQWVVSFQMYSRAVLDEIEKQNVAAKARATDEVVQTLAEKLANP